MVVFSGDFSFPHKLNKVHEEVMKNILKDNIIFSPINIYTNRNINRRISSKDHVVSRKHQRTEHTVKWDLQLINKYQSQ